MWLCGRPMKWRFGEHSQKHCPFNQFPTEQQLLLLNNPQAALLCTGTLLRSLTFPSAIHSIRTDPGDHALYAGSGDGRIFETSLVGEVSGSEGSSEQGEAGYYSMEGHNGAVTCLAMTTDATQMVSGKRLLVCSATHPYVVGRMRAGKLL